MDWLEYVLLGYMVIFPAIDWLSEKYKSDNRSLEYIKIAFFLWLPTALLIYLYQHNLLSVSNFDLPIPNHWLSYSFIGVLFALCVYLFWLIKMLKTNGQLRQQVVEKLKPGEGILPRNKKEMLLFVFLVSVSAGICEELLFRAYLMNVLESRYGLVQGVIGSSVLFGLWHLYLGRKEVIRTAIMGVLFCVIYLLSGSILIPILAHIFLDVYSGLLAYYSSRPLESQTD